MMRSNPWRLGLRYTLQATALLILGLGLAACNSANFIIPPAPEMAQDTMPEEAESMVAEAVVMAAAQSSLGCASVANQDGVRLRTGPGTGYGVLGLAYVNEALPMQGLSPDRNWVAVTAPSGTTGYIFAELTDTVCPEAQAAQ